MTNCPNCDSENSQFQYLLKKVIGKEFRCKNCQKPLYLNGLKNTFLLAIGGGVIGTLLLNQFYFNETNSTTFSIILSGFGSFLIIFMIDFLKLKFSLTKRAKPQSPPEASKEDHLKEIYSKRSNEELHSMVQDENVATEAKVIAQQIIDEREVENAS